MNAIRTRLCDLMDGTVKNKSNWHYAQIRPEGRGVTFEQALKGYVVADCSAGCGILANLAGAPNPLHSGAFDGYGNTGTSFQHLKSQNAAIGQLQVGDVIIYGPEYATHHMVMVREPGPDPIVWSNGWEGAPEYVHNSLEAAYQPKPATGFRLMPAETKPKPAPPVDTFWDWLAWYLGEGEYKGHQRDPKMRPNVPQRISATWWVRERNFIEARRKLYHTNLGR